jgi:hypothetical protein
LPKLDFLIIGYEGGSKKKTRKKKKKKVRMRKKHLNIDIDNVRMGHPAASDGEELEAAADMMEPPPPGAGFR